MSTEDHILRNLTELLAKECFISLEERNKAIRLIEKGEMK